MLCVCFCVSQRVLFMKVAARTPRRVTRKKLLTYLFRVVCGKRYAILETYLLFGTAYVELRYFEILWNVRELPFLKDGSSRF